MVWTNVSRSLPVRVTEVDNAGHPKECTISIGARSKVLNLKTSSTLFCKDFRPPSLMWLPAPDTLEFPRWRGVGENPQTWKRQSENETNKMSPFFDKKKRKTYTAIPQEFEKNGWKFDENLPHGRS